MRHDVCWNVYETLEVKRTYMFKELTEVILAALWSVCEGSVESWKEAYRQISHLAYVKVVRFYSNSN